MKLELLTTLKGTEEQLKPEWDKLVKTSGRTVFSKYAFTKNIGEFYDDLAQLQVYLAYDGRDLVGVAPLALEEGVLRFATGLDYKGIADYCDLIVHPEFREQVMDKFTKILQENGKFDLREIPEDSETLEYFRRKGIGKIKDSGEPSSFILLPEKWEEYYETLRSSYKKAHRKFLNGHGSVDLEILSDPQKLGEIFNKFIEMHQKEWNVRDMPGCFADDEKHNRFRNFHKSVSKELMKYGNLSLSLLRVNEVPVAIEYGFIDNHTLSIYLGAINGEYKRYSPGKMITLFLLQNAISKGIKRFDFLRGYEEYKNDFGVTWTQNQTILDS